MRVNWFMHLMPFWWLQCQDHVRWRKERPTHSEIWENILPNLLSLHNECRKMFRRALLGKDIQKTFSSIFEKHECLQKLMEAARNYKKAPFNDPAWLYRCARRAGWAIVTSCAELKTRCQSHWPCAERTHRPSNCRRARNLKGRSPAKKTGNGARGPIRSH